MAKQTQIGERRWRIRIEQPVSSRGTSGQEVITWEKNCEIWTKVSYRQGGSKEDMMNDQPTAQTSVIFDIAYRDTLTEKMRIVFDSEYYDILYFQKPDYKASILIFAQKQA